MKVWVNSSEIAGRKQGREPDGFMCLNYTEEPIRGNVSLGSITQEPGELPNWFCQGKSGEANIIEEAKKIVEGMNQ